MAFCPKCGKNLAPGVRFCAGCGSPLNVQQGTAPAPPRPPVQQMGYQNPMPPAGYQNPAPTGYVPPMQTGGGGALPLRFFAKILVLIALICFFFPFMTVSCSGVEEELTGLEMVIGSDDAAEAMEYQGEEGSRTDTINIFVIGAAVFGLFALLAKAKGGAALSALSAILLLVFRFTATSTYQIADVPLKDYIDEGVMEVTFGVGLYVAIALFFVASVVFGKDDSP